MTTNELNAIVKAVMDEMEKQGVDFDFKAETPQADDLVYVMRGTSDKYQGITVKWQNLLDIIVQKATEARDDAISAKDIALQTLATIQGIESNVSSMKSSVDASEANVASMKASVETSEANVTQMKSDVTQMKESVEGTKTEVEGLKSDVTAFKAQTQTIVDNAKEDVTGLLDTKVDYSDSLTYEEIMATNTVPDLTNKVASASALKDLVTLTEYANTLTIQTELTEVYSYTVKNNCLLIASIRQVYSTVQPNSVLIDSPDFRKYAEGIDDTIFCYRCDKNTSIIFKASAKQSGNNAIIVTIAEIRI